MGQKEKSYIEYMPVAKLKPNPVNAKEHASLEESFSRFGFAEPIVLDERTKMIAAGHGRREELIKLKKSGAPAPDGVIVVKGEWHVPVFRGWSTKDDDDASDFLTASNFLVGAGGWNKTKLKAALKSAAARQVPLDQLGIDKKAIAVALKGASDKAKRTSEMVADGAREQFLVLVDCKTEKKQTALLKKLITDGYEPKALTS